MTRVNPIDHATDENIPDTAVVMERITNYVKEHKYNLSENKGTVILYNGVEYQVETSHLRKGYIASIHLSNDTRSMSFESIAELRGFLRGGGNTLY